VIAYNAPDNICPILCSAFASTNCIWGIWSVILELSFLLLSFLESRSERVMGLKVCIAYGFVVALNVDDARRGIGAGADFTERPMLE
jgi:hypothetical protein